MKIRMKEWLTERELIILQNLPDWEFKETGWRTFEVAELLGVSNSAALRLLKRLEEKNYVRKIVAGRGYRWFRTKKAWDVV